MAARIEATALACGASFERNIGKLGRLVAEHHQVCALGHLGVRGERLAPDLGHQRLGALVDGIRHEHRTVPSARERPRHVACAYETDLHSAPRLPTRPAQL